MKVLFDGIIYSLQRYGGITRYFTEIIGRLASNRSIDVVLYLQGRTVGDLPSHPMLDVLQAYSFPELRPRRLFDPVNVFLQSAIRTHQCGQAGAEILHSTYYTTSKVQGLRNVLTVYDMIYELFPEYFSGPEVERFVERRRRSILLADHVFCISKNTQQDVIRLTNVREQKTSVISLASSDCFRPLTTIQKKDKIFTKVQKPFILYVGSRQNHKNFDTLLRGFSRWQGNSDFLLVAANFRGGCLGSPPTDTLGGAKRTAGAVHGSPRACGVANGPTDRVIKLFTYVALCNTLPQSTN